MLTMPRGGHSLRPHVYTYPLMSQYLPVKRKRYFFEIWRTPLLAVDRSREDHVEVLISLAHRACADTHFMYWSDGHWWPDPLESRCREKRGEDPEEEGICSQGAGQEMIDYEFDIESASSFRKAVINLK